MRRNDAIGIQEVQSMGAEGILLSPGPCTPKESGICLDILQLAMTGALGKIPIFGVCLGHQAIAHQSGSVVARASRIRHGKASPVSHDGKGVFQDMPNPFQAIRYHSLSIQEETLRPEFVITARADDDREIMGIRHQSLPIEGVQFHPESILTESGITIVRNFVRSCQAVKDCSEIR